MMDCSAYKELAGLRAEDLSAQECDGLREHIERCEICQREQQDDEELLALVDRLPTLDSNITAADIWRMDGIEPAATTEETTSDAGPRRSRTLGPVILAVAAAAALAVVLGPRLMDNPAVTPEPDRGGAEPTGQRYKAIEAPADPGSVDLQFSLETPGFGGARAIASSEGAIVGAQEKLLFGVRWTGEGDLSVIEIDPDGQLSVVASAGDVSWHVDDSGVGRMVDDGGDSLAYRPDGPSGAYTYEALLTAPAGRSLTAAEAEELLRGGDIPEISLLARDAFTIEWRQDDALPRVP